MCAQKKNEIKKMLSAETDMLAFGAHLAKSITGGAIIFLYGPLGAGKTTLTRGFLRGLGYQGKVKSPTYTLVEPYELAEKQIFHFDFFRLNDPHELENIGIKDYFNPAAICLIEWPEKGFPLLPPPDLACYIEMKDTNREIRIVAQSKQGEEILGRL